MVAFIRSRVSLVVLIGATAVVSVVILNWQWISLSAAAVLAERRPALLRDARWGDASSARQFQERFRPGVPERELTTWLTVHGFAVGPPGHASKLIRSVPCNEDVNIAWGSGPTGQLYRATAQVAEAGCL
jgi:hypothetical protein